jgi:hypothetical protein
MDASHAALDALFADPRNGGTGPGVSVSAIRKAPDAGDSFGDTRGVLPIGLASSGPAKRSTAEPMGG